MVFYLKPMYYAHFSIVEYKHYASGLFKLKNFVTVLKTIRLYIIDYVMLLSNSWRYIYILLQIDNISIF